MCTATTTTTKCNMSIFFFSAAASGSDTVHVLCTDYDGRHRGHSSTVGRGRHRVSISHLPDLSLRFFLHSCVSPSSGVLLHRAWCHLPALNPVYVPTPNLVLPYQSQRRVLGNERSRCQEDEESAYKFRSAT